ncbi:hypothetical protein OM076_04455 [Solirubrobacter ginsenosidimutans]|uniref:Uncharacterized protein n=1 Tax=Solirubrobacter ginsenosidimutans TaxID=490573 RepID=A0A9X3MNR1_9ACTN|nr:hypothetical protein [Solirubrobacter ginsenosidimutans]MDA0159505.1 hypothetical protein [Solirubrobacter ginsenosidimutans]
MRSERSVSRVEHDQPCSRRAGTAPRPAEASSRAVIGAVGPAWPSLRAAAAPAGIAVVGALAFVVLAPQRWPGWAAVLLALPLLRLLDDPAGALATASPTSLPRRRGPRLAVALPLAAAAWLGVLALSDARAGSLEAAALVATVLGLGALAVRAGFGERATLLAALPPVGLVALLRPTGTPIWVALLVAGALVLVWASRPE